MKPLNIVVDLGGTRLRVALAGVDLALTGRLEEPTIHARGPEGVIEQIVRMIHASLSSAGAHWEDVGTLVVAAPGPLDTTTGTVFSPPNLLRWGDVPLGPLLTERLGVPVKIVNDANAAALGEYEFGAGRDHRHIVYITVSTGIGGGIVVDGRLLEGAMGTAGELGHTTIDRHGPLCNCGNIGCLEVLASGTAIARRFRERLAAGETSSIATPETADSITATDVARGAAEGDPLAAAVFLDAAEALGTGVVTCINLFNPEVIIIGGGVARAGALLFDPVIRTVERYALPVPRSAARIVPAELGEDAGLVGAASIGRLVSSERVEQEV